VRLELCAMSGIHMSSGYPLDATCTSDEGVGETFLAAWVPFRGIDCERLMGDRC
jgi:hypothetical protein